MKVKLALLTAALAGSGSAYADQALAQKYACMSCHAVDKSSYGPAFKQVAAKYRGDKGALERLVAKVETGGKGVWGQKSMPPNPQVPDADAQKIVKWVLSL